MNLKRAISAVCAAAVLVSTSLSDLPAQFSAYSHAYAALTEFRYEFSQSPVAMAVQSADDGSLKCEAVTRFPADGVTNGVTTVAELRRLYSGLTVNGFEFSNSSLEGLTAEDIHTSISVLSGTDSNSYDGWYAVTDKDTLDFADMPADNDSKVVQSLSFHIYIDGGAVSRLGMKLGDRIYLNSDGSGLSYYTHTEPGGPITMTVTEATWDNSSGMSCAYSGDFEIPGVTKGVTTFGELKALYDGIKVEGYEFRGSTVEGMTETDLVPTIVLMTGSDWNWKAVYNTTKMNFSSQIHRAPIVEADLNDCMGLPMYDIAAKLFPQEQEPVRNALMDELCTFENGYLAERGGILYPQLAETLYTLSKKYPLYIVSNCQDGYIESFLTAHLMSDFFKDTECWGRTFLSKSESNKILIERNNLKNPVYVGDTAGDAKSAKDAGIDFIYAEYGFGDVSKDSYVAKIESFAELAEIL